MVLQLGVQSEVNDKYKYLLSVSFANAVNLFFIPSS